MLLTKIFPKYFEKLFEVFDAYPRTSVKSEERIVIFKRNRQAQHRPVAEYDVI